MLIGFVGDVHGMVFHALAALATLQERLGRRFDLLVQVGDMGAYPDPARMDEASRRYLEADPSQGDFARLLHAEGELAGRLRTLRTEFAGPLHFIRGNHEDYPWLRDLPVDATGSVAVDPFDLLRYVPDGTILRSGELTIAFIGGEESGASVEDGEIDPEDYGKLMELGLGEVDLLVTHEAPYGLSTGYRGRVQGSILITELVERLRPKFHLAGHYHHLNGPRPCGGTMFLGLAQLVPSAIRHPGARGLQEGCLAVLDTEKGELRPMTDAWLAEFPTPFDFAAWSDGSSARRATDATG